MSSLFDKGKKEEKKEEPKEEVVDMSVPTEDTQQPPSFISGKKERPQLSKPMKIEMILETTNIELLESMYAGIVDIATRYGVDCIKKFETNPTE